jgi:hypothetical protein
MPSQEYINMLKELTRFRGSPEESWQNAVLHNFVRESLKDSGAKMNSKMHKAMVNLAFEVWVFAKREFEKTMKDGSLDNVRA